MTNDPTKHVWDFAIHFLYFFFIIKKRQEAADDVKMTYLISEIVKSYDFLQILQKSLLLKK